MMPWMGMWACPPCLHFLGQEDKLCGTLEHSHLADMKEDVLQNVQMKECHGSQR